MKRLSFADAVKKSGPLGEHTIERKSGTLGEHKVEQKSCPLGENNKVERAFKIARQSTFDKEAAIAIFEVEYTKYKIKLPKEEHNLAEFVKQFLTKSKRVASLDELAALLSWVETSKLDEHNYLAQLLVCYQILDLSQKDSRAHAIANLKVIELIDTAYVCDHGYLVKQVHRLRDSASRKAFASMTLEQVLNKNLADSFMETHFLVPRSRAWHSFSSHYEHQCHVAVFCCWLFCQLGHYWLFDLKIPESPETELDETFVRTFAQSNALMMHIQDNLFRIMLETGDRQFVALHVANAKATRDASQSFLDDQKQDMFKLHLEIANLYWFAVSESDLSDAHTLEAMKKYVDYVSTIFVSHDISGDNVGLHYKRMLTVKKALVSRGLSLNCDTARNYRLNDDASKNLKRLDCIRLGKFDHWCTELKAAIELYRVLAPKYPPHVPTLETAADFQDCKHGRYCDEYGHCGHDNREYPEYPTYVEEILEIGKKNFRSQAVVSHLESKWTTALRDIPDLVVWIEATVVSDLHDARSKFFDDFEKIAEKKFGTIQDRVKNQTMEQSLDERKLYVDNHTVKETADTNKKLLHWKRFRLHQVDWSWFDPHNVHWDTFAAKYLPLYDSRLQFSDDSLESRNLKTYRTQLQALVSC